MIAELTQPKTLSRRDGVTVLGVFLPNEHANQFMSAGPRLTDSSYHEVRDVARLGDDVGLAFALTVARWKGVPGDNVGYAMYGLDCFTLVAALFEATKRLTIISTAHTAVWHPVIAAKLGADLDQISNGRWGLNIVAGWSASEFESMGLTLLDHDRRYEQAREWLAAVRELWLTGESSRKTDFFVLHEAECHPRPLQSGGPIVVNAGTSPAGLAFAAQNCDFLFSASADPATLAKVRTEQGSSVGYIAMKRVIVGKSDSEADEKAAEILDGADVLAIARRRAHHSSGAGDTPSAEELREPFRSNPEMVRRALLGDAVIGSASTVGKELASWITRTGVDGVCFAFYDFEESLTLLADEGFEVLGNELAGHGRQLSLRSS